MVVHKELLVVQVLLVVEVVEVNVVRKLQLNLLKVLVVQVQLLQFQDPLNNLLVVVEVELTLHLVELVEPVVEHLVVHPQLQTVQRLIQVVEVVDLRILVGLLLQEKVVMVDQEKFI
tara:strand:+ start:159 stop:509 length:351 start_codon:yes stop_codon:yes gene_type:complete